MRRVTIHFKGFLANADSSVLKINLEHGFKFESLTRQEGLSLVSALENRPLTFELMKKLTVDFPLLDLDLDAQEQSFYCISNSFEGDIEFEDKKARKAITHFPSEISKFNTLIEGYIVPAIRLMRLFKEGNIYMPLRYYYCVTDSKPEGIMHAFRGKGQPFSSRIKYALDDIEIPDLEHFIKNTSLPLEKSFLQLAFENFELSYETYNPNLAFLSLMISLETLLNPGDRELRYRVSRNTAALLGENREKSEGIFKEIRELYDKRSKLVHTGNRNAISQEDVLKLRDYVRKSIKKIQTTGSDKQNLIDALNAQGFGEKP